MVLVEEQPRERLETRWQVMVFAAGRVAPALRAERTPKLPNERSIETDSPTDLERPCAREPRLQWWLMT